MNKKLFIALALLLVPTAASQAQIYYENNNNRTTTYSTQYQTPLGATCFADTAYAYVGGRVVWTARVFGGNGVYNYSWAGSDGLNGSQGSVTIAYTTLGTKSASVYVYSGGQQVTAACTNTVNVQPYNVQSGTKTAPKITKPTAKEVISTAQPIAGQQVLENYVPWGWVFIIVFLILLSMIFYLIFNRKHTHHH